MVKKRILFSSCFFALIFVSIRPVGIMKSRLLFTFALLFLSLSYAQEKPDEELFTNVYQLPPGLLTSQSSSDDDPFAASKGRSMKEILKSYGVNFPPGASAIYGAPTAMIIIRNTEEELAKVDALFEELRLENAPRQLHIVAEYIEVEAKLYHNWMFENRITGDGTPLRKQAQEWLQDEKATLVEAISTTARSGQRAKTDSVNQVIYPTEPGIHEIPNDLQLEGDDAKVPFARSFPTAFLTRNVGSTFEVDPVLGADNVTIDLNLSPEIVQENGYTDWPPGDPDPLLSVSLPRFYKMKITTQVTSSHGRYAFLGTTDPLKAQAPKGKKTIVLVFVRSDVSTILP